MASQVDLKVVADLLAEDEISVLLAERLVDPAGDAVSVAESTRVTVGKAEESAEIDDPHRQFAEKLAERTLWSKDEAAHLAGTFGFTFLGPAIDRINEVALDTTDALLVTGDDPLEVDQEIYEEMSW